MTFKILIYVVGIEDYILDTGRCFLRNLSEGKLILYCDSSFIGEKGRGYFPHLQSCETGSNVAHFRAWCLFSELGGTYAPFEKSKARGKAEWCWWKSQRKGGCMAKSVCLEFARVKNAGILPFGRCRILIRK